jgi:hypothetical protein
MIMKSSLKKELQKIGKPKQKKKDEVYDKIIYFDKRQYSLKIPKKVMDKIGYKEEDKIRFTLIKPYKGLEDLKIEYIREKNDKK